MMCFQGRLSEIGLVNIYHHFPCFGGDGFMTTLLGQGCTATSVTGNVFVVLWMWLKEQLMVSVHIETVHFTKKIINVEYLFG